MVLTYFLSVFEEWFVVSLPDLHLSNFVVVFDWCVVVRRKVGTRKHSPVVPPSVGNGEVMHLVVREALR